MQKNILQGASGAGVGLGGSLRGFPCNGLVVSKSADWHANDRLTVSLSTPRKKTRTLVPGLPMIALAGIHDLDFGQSSAIQLAFNALNAANDYVQFAIYVDLGTLRNEDNDSSLEVGWVGGDAGEVSVAAVIRDISETDKIVSYLQTPQTQGQIGRCTDLYLFFTTAVDDPATLEGGCVVDSDFASGSCNVNDLFAVSYALGQTELVKLPRIVRAYGDPYSDVPGTVGYQLTAALAVAGFVSIIAKTVERDRERVSRATIGTMQIQRRRLAFMDPGEGKAYVRAGVGRKLSELDAMIKSSNIKG